MRNNVFRLCHSLERQLKMKYLLIANFKVDNTQPKADTVNCIDYLNIYRVWYTTLQQSEFSSYDIVLNYDYKYIVFAIKFSQLSQVLDWPQDNIGNHRKWTVIVCCKDHWERDAVLEALGTDYNLFLNVIFVEQVSKINTELKKFLKST